MHGEGRVGLIGAPAGVGEVGKRRRLLNADGRDRREVLG